MGRLTRLRTGEMEPYYIMRYGFYEGHTEYRVDPIALAVTFGLKTTDGNREGLPRGTGPGTHQPFHGKGQYAPGSSSKGPTRRYSEREPADSPRDKSNVIGGWLPSLTLSFWPRHHVPFPRSDKP